MKGTVSEKNLLSGRNSVSGRLPLTELQALALSILDRLWTSVSKTFIFSTRHVSAVSVASPTFSYTPFTWSIKHNPGYSFPSLSSWKWNAFIIVFWSSQKASCSNLIEVQRGVITQRADGGQFHQSLILGAFHWFAIVVTVKRCISLKCAFFYTVKSWFVSCICPLYSHFSFRCVGWTCDGEFWQRAAFSFCFVEYEHLRIKEVEIMKTDQSLFLHWDSRGQHCSNSELPAVLQSVSLVAQGWEAEISVSLQK